MPAVGAYLRELRERQGVSLDEISRSTRVLHHYLEALESDNLAALPAPVFAKGFIRAYCQALGVAPDEAIAMYDQKVGQSHTPASLVPPPRVTQLPRPAPQPKPAAAPRPVAAPKSPAPPAATVQHVPAPAHVPTPAVERAAVVERAVERPPVERRESRTRGTVLISFVLLVVLGTALYAVTIALQSGRDEVDAGAAVHVAAPPAIQTSSPEPAHSEPIPPPPPQPLVNAQQPSKQSPVTQPSPAPMPSTPTAVASPAAPSQAASAIVAPYRLVARTSETTWMRVRTEDGRTSEETIPANEVREWVSNGPFVLTIGNAGGVSLELNGRPVPRLGASGAVITRMVLPSDAQ
jgi:cytoskeleton protein RodZ